MRAPLALLGACFGRSERPSARPCVKVHLGLALHPSRGVGKSQFPERVRDVRDHFRPGAVLDRALPTVNRDGFTNHSDGCDDSFVALLGADTNHNREVLCFKDRCCLSHTRTNHVGSSGDIIGPLPLPREPLHQCARKPLREGG